ncbi:hypothetical protein [Thalassobaculum sp.]|uniref:hypothetical protein n=1 Tax=Thalassobaculum sp. TaxID=2022740 RepID=UPI0032EF33DC
METSDHAAPDHAAYVWHSFYSIINAMPRFWPFRHLVLENFLHQDLFDALMASRFETALTRRNDPAKIGYTSEIQRFSIPLNDADAAKATAIPSLVKLWSTLADDRLTKLLIQKFSEDIAKRHNTADMPTEPAIEVIEDQTGYALSPHTDTHRKLVTTLIYLAEANADETLGTTIYALEDPKRLGSEVRNGARLPREAFSAVTRIPYRPNTALVFAPGMNSFHGVEPVAPGRTRRLIQFQVNQKK